MRHLNNKMSRSSNKLSHHVLSVGFQHCFHRVSLLSNPVYLVLGNTTPWRMLFVSRCPMVSTMGVVLARREFHVTTCDLQSHQFFRQSNSNATAFLFLFSRVLNWFQLGFNRAQKFPINHFPMFLFSWPYSWTPLVKPCTSTLRHFVPFR